MSRFLLSLDSWISHLGNFSRLHIHLDDFGCRGAHMDELHSSLQPQKHAFLLNVTVGKYPTSLQMLPVEDHPPLVVRDHVHNKDRFPPTRVPN